MTKDGNVKGPGTVRATGNIERDGLNTIPVVKSASELSTPVSGIAPGMNQYQLAGAQVEAYRARSTEYREAKVNSNKEAMQDAVTTFAKEANLDETVAESLLAGKVTIDSDSVKGTIRFDHNEAKNPDGGIPEQEKLPEGTVVTKNAEPEGETALPNSDSTVTTVTEGVARPAPAADSADTKVVA
jgi:hypothetical protein